MHATFSNGGRELGRRGRRPIRRDIDLDDQDNTPAMTFTSSLGIGPSAPPLPNTSTRPPHKDAPQTVPPPVPVDTSAGMRRTSRKSKTDALAAIIRAGSPTSDTLPGNSISNGSKPTPVLRPIPQSDELDLSTVPEPKKGVSEPSRQSPRLFGLEECPTYYPTPEQFSDPMGYITSISHEAEKYGLCKIVPPKDWNMPFVTNTKVRLHFFRQQHLN